MILVKNDLNNWLIHKISKYYELNDKFPRQNLLVRNPNQQAGRTIYLTSEVMKNVIESNDYTRLRLISWPNLLVLFS